MAFYRDVVHSADWCGLTDLHLLTIWDRHGVMLRGTRKRRQFRCSCNILRDVRFMRRLLGFGVRSGLRLGKSMGTSIGSVRALTISRNLDARQGSTVGSDSYFTSRSSLHVSSK